MDHNQSVDVFDASNGTAHADNAAHSIQILFRRSTKLISYLRQQNDHFGDRSETSYTNEVQSYMLVHLRCTENVRESLQLFHCATYRISKVSC